MRFVLCDSDELFTSMIELMLNDLGHVVVGVGTTTADSVLLLETARPDVVIVDLSMGFNTDFDVITAAGVVGATAIVFSHHADDAIIRQYPVRPTVVFKPDLTALERVVSRLGLDNAARVRAHDRRARPAHAASGPQPTGISDAQAFYEALNAASAGDVLVSIEVSEELDHAAEMAERVRSIMRDTDRLLASQAVVRVYLPAGGDVGATSFRGRLHEIDTLSDDAIVRCVVLTPDEDAAAAFERLKSAGPDPY